jgi:hypothetical protein
MTPGEYRARAKECEERAGDTLDRTARESFEYLARQ